MRIALLTDIHGNREALDACLADMRRMAVERTIFLGDYVGYGADPAYVVDVVRAQVEGGAVALLGNHDAAIETPDPFMNPLARAAIDWTRTRLDRSRRDFLARLPLRHEEGERLFVHANAVAPAQWGYVTDRLEAARSMMATQCRSTFCGHVHVPCLYHIAPNGLLGETVPVAGTPLPLAADRRWLAVIGAVGQPRDGNPAACYALLDGARSELTYLRVPYDVDAAARKILAAGLPARLAARLARGW